MSTRLVNVDRDSPMLLPPDLRDGVPAEHVMYFLLDDVAALDPQVSGSTPAAAAVSRIRPICTFWRENGHQ